MRSVTGMKRMNFGLVALVAGLLLVEGVAFAQERLPEDNGLATYHTAPRWRESESHPLRVLAYALHPVGWLAREVFFRPLSYFASSSPARRSIMGFREPYGHRQPECFSADSSVPDCRAYPPYNYDSGAVDVTEPVAEAVVERTVYFPDVNFDFDVRKLNDLGRGRVHQISKLLETSGGGVHVVLEGHTDYIGSDKYNEKLGLDRAEAVRAELVSLGISADRLSTVTFGKTKPIFTEQEDWARAVNRRVELVVGVEKPVEAAPAAVQ